MKLMLECRTIKTNNTVHACSLNNIAELHRNMLTFQLLVSFGIFFLQLVLRDAAEVSDAGVEAVLFELDVLWIYFEHDTWSGGERIQCTVFQRAQDSLRCWSFT